MKKIRLKESTVIKIEKYLNGTLSQPEIILFEQEIASTPILREAIINYKIANDAIESMIEDKTRALLN